MINKLLGLAMITSQLANPSYGNDLKLLEMEADAFAHKVWSKAPIAQHEIKTSLNFLKDSEKVKEKYRDPISFKTFYKHVMKQAGEEQENLLSFAKKCKTLYENEENEKSKTAIYILLEQVTRKYSQYLQIAAASSRNRNMRTKKDDRVSEEELIRVFKNADKTISLNGEENSYSAQSAQPDIFSFFSKRMNTKDTQAF